MAPISPPSSLTDQAKKLWKDRVEKLTTTARGREHNGPLINTVIEDTDPNDPAGPYNVSYRELKLDDQSLTYKEIQQNLASDTGLAKHSTFADLTSLKYTTTIVPAGSDGSGSPLYLSLHGGGESPKIKNDVQWALMCPRYTKQIPEGVYVAIRGMGNTWDLNFSAAMYVLMERLIENMIMFQQVDPNRVYLLGFSAGGDAVYRLATHLSQRFAAVNAGGGHPGDVQFDNLLNTAIILQVGEQDRVYARCQVVAKTGIALDELQRSSNSDSYSGAYPHNLFIHQTPKESNNDYGAIHWGWEAPYADLDHLVTPQNPAPKSRIVTNYKNWSAGNPVPAPDDTAHNEDDLPDCPLAQPAPDSNIELLDTNPIYWLNQYNRQGGPFQKSIIQAGVPLQLYWKLGSVSNGHDNWTTAVNQSTSGMGEGAKGRLQHFWLDIGRYTAADVGDTIQVKLNKTENTIIVASAKKYLRFLLRDGMMDLSKPVIVKFKQGHAPLQITVNRDNPTVITDTLIRNDPNLIFTADVIIQDPNNTGNWTISTSARGT